MSVPADYDSARIAVSPLTLYSARGRIESLTQDVASQLGTIYSTLNDLQLSWVGSSATLSKQYSDRLNAASDSLFGTDQAPDSGAFNDLIAGLGSGSQNYDLVEQWVTKAFNAFANAFSATIPGGPPDQIKSSSPTPSAPSAAQDAGPAVTVLGNYT